MCIGNLTTKRISISLHHVSLVWGFPTRNQMMTNGSRLILEMSKFEIIVLSRSSFFVKFRGWGSQGSFSVLECVLISTKVHEEWDRIEKKIGNKPTSVVLYRNIGDRSEKPRCWFERVSIAEKTFSWQTHQQTDKHWLLSNSLSSKKYCRKSCGSVTKFAGLFGGSLYPEGERIETRTEEFQYYQIIQRKWRS